jgi:DNA-3-methyladenine glycosylase I
VKIRCFGDGDPLYERYHDEEWGKPVTGEGELFERLVLESFQSGLAWITILRKRDGFRRAFAGFDVDAVAGFDERDVARLLEDASIVRHRGKIEAAIANARATVALHDGGGTLRALLWEGGDAPDVAKELKRRGFRFLGPTTVESAMQACGVIDAHGEGCWLRSSPE